MLARADAVYAVTAAHQAVLCRAEPAAAAKTRTLGADIPDPWHVMIGGAMPSGPIHASPAS